MREGSVEVCGQRVGQLRRERGLTLEKLGKLIGYSGSWVYHFEANPSRAIDIRIARRLTRALGTSMDYLMGNSEVEDFADSAESKEILSAMALLTQEERQSLWSCVQAMAKDL